MEFDLRIIRALLKLTSKELAKDLGVSRQTISSLENGRSKTIKPYKLAIGYLVEHKYCDVPPEIKKLIQEMIEN